MLLSLEHQRRCVKIYECAIQCARRDDLRSEWSDSLAESEQHERVLVQLFESFELDPLQPTPGRTIVRDLGAALVKAMIAGKGRAAQLIACEAVVDAEAKKQFHWGLLATVADRMAGERATVLAAACAKVVDEEGACLGAAKAWHQALWLEALGVVTVLPPDEHMRKMPSSEPMPLSADTLPVEAHMPELQGKLN